MRRNKNNCLLWELSIPGGIGSSFIFGTIHLPDKTLFHRIDEVKGLIDKCECFIAEYNLDQEEANFALAFMNEANCSPKELLSFKRYQKLQSQIEKSFGVDIQALNRLKPMIIENYIALSLIDVSAENPMDLLLWNFASDADKRMLGAETLESQANIMQYFPVKQQLKTLLAIGNNPANYRKTVNKLKDSYRREDISYLYRRSVKGLGNMKRKLVHERNYIISDSILSSLQDSTLVCAVGAGHLSGYKGILRILKQKGVRVKPIHSSSYHP